MSTVSAVSTVIAVSTVFVVSKVSTVSAVYTVFAVSTVLLYNEYLNYPYLDPKRIEFVLGRVSGAIEASLCITCEMELLPTLYCDLNPECW